jgi:hypothetical protein
VASRDRLVSAINGLEPESRALIELSARRGMTDAEVAGVMGVAAEDVQARRERAMKGVARAVGSSADRDLRQELEGLDEEDWARPASSAAEAGGRRRRRTSPRFLAAAGAVLVLIAAVGAVLIALAGNESKPESASAPPQPQRAAERAGAVTFKRFRHTHGRGTVQMLRGPGAPACAFG